MRRVAVLAALVAVLLTPTPAGAQAGPGGGPRVLRLAGPDRVTTAIAISGFGISEGGASHAVLARADDPADALAGTALAAFANGELLVTAPHDLDRRVGAELQRALLPGATVILLGGDRALSGTVENDVVALGYRTERLSGPDRFATSVAIARRTRRPSMILVSTGRAAADALSAGTVAGRYGGVVVLTDGDRLPASVAGYLAEHPDVPTFAIGGPAAAAVPGATPIVGADRYTTAVMVAGAFFPTAVAVGFANGISGVDALAGGVHAARIDGPLLLVERDRLPPAVEAWVDGRELALGMIYGGTSAISAAVEATLRAKIEDP